MARKRPAVEIKPEDLALLVQELRQSPTDNKHKAAATIAKLARADAVSRVNLARLGAIPPLVAMLKVKPKRGVPEALGALSNLTMDNRANCVEIASHGVIPLLIPMLSGNNKVAFRSVKALRNLAIENEANCLEIMANGGIPLLLSMLEAKLQNRRPAMETLESLANTDRTAAWAEIAGTESFRSRVVLIQASKQRIFLPALSKLAGIDESNLVWITRHVAIPHCIKMLRSSDNQKMACGAEFIKALASEDGNIDALVQLDAILLLINMLNGSIKVKTKAFKALDVLANFQSNRVEMVRLGAIPLLIEMSNGRKQLKHKATVMLQKLKMENQMALGIESEPRASTLLDDQAALRRDKDDDGELCNDELQMINVDQVCANSSYLLSQMAPRSNNCFTFLKALLTQIDSEAPSFSYSSRNDGSSGSDQASEIAANLRLLRGTLREKTVGAKRLAKLTRDDEVNCTEIVRQGGIPLLVAELQGRFELKQYAAETLRNLACVNPASRVLIAKHGAIPLLAGLLKGPSIQQSYAAKALGNLAFGNEENRMKIQQCGAIASLIMMVQGSKLQIREAAATLEIIADSNDQEWIEIGTQEEILSLVVLFPMYQFKFSIPKLTNLAGITDENRPEILRLVVIPYCSYLLRGGNNAQVKFAVNAFKHLATINDVISTWVTQTEVISDLVSLLITDHKCIAANVLGLLAQDNIANQIAIVQNGAIPLLFAMSKGPTREKSEALLALNNLANSTNMYDGSILPPHTNMAKLEANLVLNWRNRTVASSTASKLEVTMKSPWQQAQSFETFESAEKTQKRKLRSYVAYFKATRGRASRSALERLTGIDDGDFVWITHHVAIPFYVRLLRNSDDEDKVFGAKSIKALANMENGDIEVIIRYETIRLLMGMLNTSSYNELKIQVTETLRVLATNKASRLEMIRLGLIPILFEMSKYGAEFMSEEAAVLLSMLLKDNDESLGGNDDDSSENEGKDDEEDKMCDALFCYKVIKMLAENTKYGDLSVLVQELRQSPANRKRIAAAAVANFARSGSAMRAELVQAGVIYPLVGMLKSKSIEAAIALSALANKNQENSVAIASYGAIPLLIAMLSGHAAHESAHTLRRLAFDNDANYFEIVENGGILPLILMLEGTKKARKEAIKTLEILANVDYEATWTDMVFKEKFRSCIALIQITKGLQSLPVLSKLAGIDKSKLVWNTQHVAIPYYVHLLSNSEDEKKACGAECIENLAKVGNGNIDVIVQHNALRFLLSLLKCNDTVKKKAIKALTALTNCAVHRIELVRLGAIPLLIEMSSGSKAFDRRSTALLHNLRQVDLKSLGMEIELLETIRPKSDDELSGAYSQISDDDGLSCDLEAKINNWRQTSLDQKPLIVNALDRIPCSSGGNSDLTQTPDLSQLISC